MSLFSPTTKVVPTTATSTQTTQIPEWLTKAGQTATNVATDIATKPYTPYEGDLVAPLSGNQLSAINMAADTSTGADSLNLAKTGAAGALNLAGNSVGAGSGSLGTAGQIYGVGAGLAADSLGAGDYGSNISALGAGQLSDIGSMAYGSAGDYLSGVKSLTDLSSSSAQNSQGAGADSVNAGKSMYGAAADAAVNSNNAGLSSLGKASDTIDAAGNQAISSLSAGSNALGSAYNDFGIASLLGQSQTGAGKNSIDLGADAANLATGVSAGTVDAGQGDVDLMRLLGGNAALSSLTGADAGLSDLEAARNYTSGSAGAVTPEMIDQYFNPYVENALAPTERKISSAADKRRAELARTAAMRGSFGGDRQAVLENGIAKDELNAISDLYATGYANAWDKATGLATDELGRRANAAGLSLDTARLSGDQSSQALSRIIDAAQLSGQTGQLQSDLYSQGVGRLLNSASTAGEMGTRQSDQATSAQDRLLASGEANRLGAQTESALATEGQNRLYNASNAYTNLGAAESGLATENVNRLSSTAPGLIDAGVAESGMATADLDRLLAARGANQSGISTVSDLVSKAGQAGVDQATLDNILSSGELERVMSVGSAMQGLGASEAGLATEDVNRVLNAISPNLAATEMSLNKMTTDLNNLVATGAISQQQAQNEYDAAYQQYLAEQSYAADQLNALISVLSGVPYGTTTTAKSTQQNVISGGSVASQIAGLGAAGASLIAASDRDLKMNIVAVNDESVLDDLQYLFPDQMAA